jgi:drug/metabolite transporter (DMT)-like permease
MAEKNLHRQSVLILLAVTMLWGGGFIATEYAINSGLDTAWILTSRFLLAAFVLGALFRRKVRASSRSDITHGVIAGASLFGGFYAQTSGQALTTVSSAAFITATSVVMIPFLLWAMAKRRPSWLEVLLCLTSMGGVLLLTVDFAKGLSFSAGDLLVLLCALLFALHTAYVGHYCKNDDATNVTFWQLLTAGAGALIVLLLRRPPITAAQFSSGMWPVAYLGLFSTCLCYALQTRAQQHVPASQAGVVMSMEGVFGTLFSLALGFEALRFNMALGGALITISVVLTEVGARRVPERCVSTKSQQSGDAHEPEAHKVQTL